MRHLVRSSGPLVLAGVLAALLLVLASLQWRWLGRISADERERMQTSLRSQVSQFTQEFDRELTRAFFWLQSDRIPGPTPAAANSIAHFQRWFASAPHAPLVRAIYTVSVEGQPPGPRGAPAATPVMRVSAYDRQRDRLLPLPAAPAELTPILGRLTAQPWPVAGGSERGSTTSPGPVADEGPALVIARPPVPVVDAGGSIVFSELERPWDFTIALLDTEYIRETFLPELLERHFGAGSAAAYRVSIVNRATGAQVFCTDGRTATCAITAPDASEEFFEVRMREFNRFVVVDDRRGAPARGSSANRSRGGPPPTTRTLALGAGRPGDDEGRRSDRRPLWRADFAHQAGSLEAVVASTRRRNLFVSSSVLLLLGASITMLVISSARARTLAAQQMEFVAGVSHELRTPLAVIRSAAENLADGVVADREQVQRYGQLIAGEGRRLTEMVEQVMEFAGFDAGRTLDVQPVRAVDIAQAAIEACGPLFAETDAHVDLETPDGVLVVCANHAALARSIQNLISNAVKYGGADRWVGMRVTAADHRMVAFAVSDHGRGIAEQDLPRIFEPFYRGQQAVDGHVHGSGLGLSLVARIVTQHGGRVTVDSTAARGTTFTLFIPSVPEAFVTVDAASPTLATGTWRKGSQPS
ncbi:MAG: ATP-binding protein [Luteitalea sp.]